MKYLSIIVFLLTAYLPVYAQPANDDCAGAITIASGKEYCSGDGAYTTVGATPSFNGAGADVWFKFTPRDAYDLYINVYGAGNGGTLTAPVVRLFANCPAANGTFNEIVGASASSGNTLTFYKGGLIIGRTYYFTVSGNNTGNFKLCLRNIPPLPSSGNDCSSAILLCSKDAVQALNVSGAGANPNEGRGSCFDAGATNSESNSSWYKWVAANNGSLVFTISPTKLDDLDWVLFDLGTSGSCANVTPANILRCAAGSGIDCNPAYTKTGMSLTETDINEQPGCVAGQNGFVSAINMVAGHYYGLLVNNFSQGNNGFTIDFRDPSGNVGTGEFVGPKAAIQFQANTPCVAGQSFTFTSNSTGYTGLHWIFGLDDDPSIRESTSEGPITITYATLGTKTVVLEAAGSNGCQVLATYTFEVGLKPLTPEILSGKPQYCIGDTIVLSATQISGATYTWAGPNNYTASGQQVAIPVTTGAAAGTYRVFITENGCQSDVGTFTVPAIIPSPKASFRTDPQLPAKLSFPVTVRFTNQSVNSDAWLWDFGDGSTATEENPEHTYSARGDYKVTLTAINKDVCTASTIKGTFVIREANTIFIPNTFTPNGDGVNDELVVTLTDLTNYHLHIYNRWGEQVFESIDIFDNWKGTYRNEPLPVGTYYYLITANDAAKKTVRRSGSVTLIR